MTSKAPSPLRRTATMREESFWGPLAEAFGNIARERRADRRGHRECRGGG